MSDLFRSKSPSSSDTSRYTRNHPFAHLRHLAPARRLSGVIWGRSAGMEQFDTALQNTRNFSANIDAPLPRSNNLISACRPATSTPELCSCKPSDVASTVVTSLKNTRDWSENSKRKVMRLGKKLKHCAARTNADLWDNNIPDFQGSESVVRSASFKRRNDSTPSTLPYKISQPMNFRHLAHAQPQHFKNISRRTNNDLVGDFSALRAAQASREDLRGIRVQDIGPRSSWAVTAPQTPAHDFSMHTSAVPSLASESSRESMASVCPTPKTEPVRHPPVRGHRAKESFSQPFFYIPPRVSSMKATTRRKSQSQHTPAASKAVCKAFAKPEPQAQTIDTVLAADAYPVVASDIIHTLSAMREIQAMARDGYPTWTYGEYPDLYNDSMYGYTVDVQESIPTGFLLDETPPGETRDSYFSSKSVSDTSTVTPTKATRVRYESGLPSKVEVTLQRSSVMNGLFSSWEMDDDVGSGETPPLRKLRGSSLLNSSLFEDYANLSIYDPSLTSSQNGDHMLVADELDASKHPNPYAPTMTEGLPGSRPHSPDLNLWRTWQHDRRVEAIETEARARAELPTPLRPPELPMEFLPVPLEISEQIAHHFHDHPQHANH